MRAPRSKRRHATAVLQLGRGPPGWEGRWEWTAGEGQRIDDVRAALDWFVFPP